MKRNIIELEKLVVAYREGPALRGISVQIQAGEMVGIIGPNGAGKTTFLTVINGLARLARGRVEVLGENLTARNANALRKRIGYVPQLPNIDRRMPLNVREAVMIGRYGWLGWGRQPGWEDEAAVGRALERVGLAPLAERPIGHLSGGEQQRAAIARCLAQEAEIWLLDEPTASLDWQARHGIVELIERTHEERELTTIYVTHDLGALPPGCQRVVLMKEGRIWAEGRPADLLTDQNLSWLYGIPVSEVKARRSGALVS